MKPIKRPRQQEQRSILANCPQVVGIKVDRPDRRPVKRYRAKIGPVKVRSGKIGLAEVGLSEIRAA